MTLREKVVVVSAPGKRFKEDIKVTDLLLSCVEQYLSSGEGKEAFEAVVVRYKEIADYLGVSAEVVDRISMELLEILHGDRSDAARFRDAVVASGEDNCAKKSLRRILTFKG
ncbi:hypothetical protein GCM10020331_076890 [Ectobacillus funiculus]